MRTLKTLAAAGVVLLVAGSASAGLILTVRAATPDDGDADANVEVDVQLVNQATPIDVFQFDFLHNGDAFGSWNAVGPGPIGVACGSHPQSMCNWGSFTVVGAGGNNATGDNWLWDSGPGESGNATFTGIALFTTTATSGTVSVGNFEIYDANGDPVTDITVIPYTAPEPGVAALLGLGLFGLALGRRRRS